MEFLNLIYSKYGLSSSFLYGTTDLLHVLNSTESETVWSCRVSQSEKCEVCACSFTSYSYFQKAKLAWKNSLSLLERPVALLFQKHNPLQSLFWSFEFEFLVFTHSDWSSHELSIGKSSLYGAVPDCLTLYRIHGESQAVSQVMCTPLAYRHEW